MLEIKGDKFYLSGKKFNIYSGAIHYFRVLPQYWEDRLYKLKLAGFNTVETYIPWNLHEPKKGVCDFEGILNVEGFIDKANELGLYVILRPGPYICTELDFGGLPAWLLSRPDIRVRCCDEMYLKYVKGYYDVLLKKLCPYQITHGGNVIAMQIENEYGSYGNDKNYLRFLENLLISSGIDILLFTSDGHNDSMLTGGTLPHIFKTVNFGSHTNEAFGKLKERQPDRPLMCMEFWNGWFDHWEEEHHVRNYQDVVYELKTMLNSDANVNFYMFHGGTNFGFNSGANFSEKYEPTVTSYDSDALINEWGGYTDKYHAVREVLLKHQNLPFEPLPPEPKRQVIGEVTLSKAGSFMGNIESLGVAHFSVIPKSMECFGQSFGFILYRCRIDGEYEAMPLTISGLGDRAYIFVNNEFKGMIYRNDEKQYIEMDSIGKDGATIDILVEAMGRINYGLHLHDRKGISGTVSLAQQNLYNWDVYTLPLDNIGDIQYNGDEKPPVFLKGEFISNSKEDCFVQMEGFTKGLVFVNGFNLGRYWNKGPQMSLYLPGELLRNKNEIIVLELEHYKANKIIIDDRHKI